MKRLSILILAVCMLCMALACAKQQSSEPETAPAVTAPGEREVKLTLPLSSRSDVAEALSGYTAGFSAASGAPLFYAVRSSDEAVAKGVLGDDGTLYVIARGAGDAKLTVTAATLAGEQAEATVTVKVFDARRTLVLIVLGVLAVTLLVLLGKPSAKKPEPAEEPEKAPDPVLIFEEPKQESEVPQHDR